MMPSSASANTVKPPLIAPDAHVDAGSYQTNNICGALVPESLAVLRAVALGVPPNEVRERALSGELFPQTSRESRRRFWYAIHARYLEHAPPWVLAALARHASGGRHDPTTLGVLYLHFALRDRLTFDWLTGPVWTRWSSGQRQLSRDDTVESLRQLSTGADLRWSVASQKKLASSLLSALRDFGIARGVQRKTLQRPVVSVELTAHVLRILVERGVRGGAVIQDPTWRLFLRSPEDVTGELASLAQTRTIRFERAGSSVVLETPWGEA